MKKLIAIFCILTVIPAAFAGTYVKGYFRSDGTYVAPHYRSESYRSKMNKRYKNNAYNPYSYSKKNRTKAIYEK